MLFVRGNCNLTLAFILIIILLEFNKKLCLLFIFNTILSTQNYFMEIKSIMLYRKPMLIESNHGNYNNTQRRKIIFQQVRIILHEKS